MFTRIAFRAAANAAKAEFRDNLCKTNASPSGTEFFTENHRVSESPKFVSKRVVKIMDTEACGRVSSVIASDEFF